ncbi:MAG: Ig-like domain-containing protein, partial [Muribaculaceae bacterium]|nr:Ig-like domain-containing protein [Muribaculaceae bacterium]
GSELESSIRFTAIGGEVLIENISISPEARSVYVNETFTLKAKIFPDDVTNKELVWRIDNPEVASFINGSRIKLLKVGTATISAEATDGSGVSASCKVTVLPILVESIQLTPESWNGVEEDSFSIVATVYPPKATNTNVVWSSSDEAIASVDNQGNVSVLKEGSCVITATAEDGSGASTECVITSLAGIEEIFSDTALLDIYDMNGLLIGKDCDKEHLKTLTPGIYLIRFEGGMKKLVIR